MKVLVATKETQGKRASDFSHAEEGELVYFGFVCDRDTEKNPDGGCGCARSMSGMHSRKATTTVKVVDQLDMTPELLRLAVEKAYEAGGWKEMMKDNLAELAEWCVEQVHDLTEAANAFSEGSVLEYRGYNFTRRD